MHGVIYVMSKSWFPPRVWSMRCFGFWYHYIIQAKDINDLVAAMQFFYFVQKIPHKGDSYYYNLVHHSKCTQQSRYHIWKKI